MYSTGGTQTFIEQLGFPVTPVESLTGYPSILGGRVKTLHPKIFGGILGRRGLEGDRQQMSQYAIPKIDLVVVDLYPFEETVASGGTEADIIEKIDIGGISLIRAAAKNFADVLTVSSRSQYKEVAEMIRQNEGASTLAERRWYATAAFAMSSHYDSAIFNWFNTTEKVPMLAARISLNDGQKLRYGENPHQSATFFSFTNTDTPATLAGAVVLQGKALSYNNMLDADAAWKAVSDAFHAAGDMPDKSAVAVIKHLNPCGLAVSDDTIKSLELAWAGDPISAYGGIIAFSSPVTGEIALWFANRFVEVIVAPSFTMEAQAVFARKGNLRLLVAPLRPATCGEKTCRSINGGMLIQDEDEGPDIQFEQKTEIRFDESKLGLAKFGIAACKHLKSNAIALVSQTADGSVWLTGAGMGQPNRLDSLQQLTIPRFRLKEGVNIAEAVLISDAFFPFRDSIDAANKFGVKFIVQPGGSIRDAEVISACNEHGIAMLFTNRRHFRH
jgi:phosphoribosylaminoimidazolecarboxamide formyltransferase/IMP cyclohydrolase